jgi:hypothetical protein
MVVSQKHRQHDKREEKNVKEPYDITSAGSMLRTLKNHCSSPHTFADQ